MSIRTLQYYDKIGLLKPSEHTGSGYRLYDDATLERLQQILLFKELEFSLKEIKTIIDAPDFDRKKALEQQIELLIMKKEHLENLIDFARGIKLLGIKRGVSKMDFTAFDKTKLDEYAKRAKEQWGKSSEYKEFEKKTGGMSDEEQLGMVDEFMQVFAEFGQMMYLEPSDEKVQAQVKKLQRYITEHFYTCTKEILSGLGKMYSGGGEFTENIDKAGGKGTADFTNKAIEIYCNK